MKQHFAGDIEWIVVSVTDAGLQYVNFKHAQQIVECSWDNGGLLRLTVGYVEPDVFNGREMFDEIKELLTKRNKPMKQYAIEKNGKYLQHHLHDGWFCYTELAFATVFGENDVLPKNWNVTSDQRREVNQTREIVEQLYTLECNGWHLTNTTGNHPNAYRWSAIDDATTVTKAIADEYETQADGVVTRTLVT